MGLDEIKIYHLSYQQIILDLYVDIDGHALKGPENVLQKGHRAVSPLGPGVGKAGDVLHP